MSNLDYLANIILDRDFIQTLKKSKWYLLPKLTDKMPEGFESDLKVGDTVIFTNDYGVKFESKIYAFAENDLQEYTPDAFVFLDNDSYWMPVSLSRLEKTKK